jgi:hypothetical protein
VRQLAAFHMTINYTQIAVHRPDQPDVFEQWTREDFERGHMARDGHAVFGVNDHNGRASIAVSLADGAPDRSAVAVDFRVKNDGIIITTPVGYDHDVAVPEGRYKLAFAVSYRPEEGIDINLIFWRL